MDIGWAAEPALWVGLVEAIIVLAVAFGAPLTTDQKTAIIGATSAVVAIVGAIVTRSQVTPTAKLAPAPVSVPVVVPAPPAAGGS